MLRHKRVRLLKALEGTWPAPPRFALRQALEGWEFDQRQISAWEQQSAAGLKEVAAAAPAPPPPTAAGTAHRTRVHHHAPQSPALHELWVRLSGGQELSTLPALTDYRALPLLGEGGTDRSRWPPAKPFTAWRGWAPSSRSRGKRRRREKRFRGRAGQIFCVMARSLARSTYLALGGFYRRLRATRGPQAANVAAARKSAVLYYHTLRYGRASVEQGLQRDEAAYRQQCLRRLERNAAQCGLTLIPATPAIEANA
jgi:transposase